MLNGEFFIRATQIEDAPGIAFVQQDAWQKTYKGIVADSYLDAMNIEERVERWKSYLKAESVLGFNCVMLNAEHHVIGMVGGGKSRSTEINCEAEIYALYLLKEYQGQGLGKKLFLYAIQRLMEMNFTSCCLYVLTQNPTLHFYKKFMPDKELPLKIEIGGVEYDETLLGWADMSIFPIQTRQYLF